MTTRPFHIEPSKESKAVHLIPVVFTAGQDPGRIAEKISIRTDQGDNVVQAFTAFAEVIKADPAKPKASVRESAEKPSEPGKSNVDPSGEEKSKDDEKPEVERPPVEKVEAKKLVDPVEKAPAATWKPRRSPKQKLTVAKP